MNLIEAQAARKAAGKSGEVHYIGTPCIKCGQEKRYVVSGNCVPCSNKRTMAYNDKNREKVRENGRRWRAKNAVYLSAYQQARRQVRKEKPIDSETAQEAADNR